MATGCGFLQWDLSNTTYPGTGNPSKLPPISVGLWAWTVWTWQLHPAWNLFAKVADIQNSMVWTEWPVRIWFYLPNAVLDGAIMSTPHAGSKRGVQLGGWSWQTRRLLDLVPAPSGCNTYFDSRLCMQQRTCIRKHGIPYSFSGLCQWS